MSEQLSDAVLPGSASMGLTMAECRVLRDVCAGLSDPSLDDIWVWRATGRAVSAHRRAAGTPWYLRYSYAILTVVAVWIVVWWAGGAPR